MPAIQPKVLTTLCNRHSDLGNEADRPAVQHKGTYTLQIKPSTTTLYAHPPKWRHLAPHPHLHPRPRTYRFLWSSDLEYLLHPLAMAPSNPAAAGKAKGKRDANGEQNGSYVYTSKYIHEDWCHLSVRMHTLWSRGKCACCLHISLICFC